MEKDKLMPKRRLPVEEKETKEGKNKKRPYKRKLLKGQTTLTNLIKKIKIWLSKLPRIKPV